MPFTGKATYTIGKGLPELVEDIADLIHIVAPHEVPLLDALGDPLREATSIRHEWMEDELLPNKDAINDATWTNPAADTTFDVDNGSRFRTGDQIQVEGSEELMFVTGVADNTLTVLRGYAGTTPENLGDNQIINILGNATWEDASRPNARFTNRVRHGNYTQVFTETVEASIGGAMMAQFGLADEMDFQKTEKLRKLLHELENAVINGGSETEGQHTNPPVRRLMQGIIPRLSSNVIDAQGKELDETQVNAMLRQTWENSSGNVDLIVVSGFQKPRMNTIIDTRQAFDDTVLVYESDFGICRVVTTRWVPQDAVLFLDSSRISVLPLAGRSFHFKPLATAGDYECGELIGEYTLELKNEAAHGIIRNLRTET